MARHENLLFAKRRSRRNTVYDILYFKILPLALNGDMYFHIQRAVWHVQAQILGLVDKTKHISVLSVLYSTQVVKNGRLVQR